MIKEPSQETPEDETKPITPPSKSAKASSESGSKSQNDANATAKRRRSAPVHPTAVEDPVSPNGKPEKDVTKDSAKPKVESPKSAKPKEPQTARRSLPATSFSAKTSPGTTPKLKRAASAKRKSYFDDEEEEEKPRNRIKVEETEDEALNRLLRTNK